MHEIPYKNVLKLNEILFGSMKYQQYFIRSVYLRGTYDTSDVLE